MFLSDHHTKFGVGQSGTFFYNRWRPNSPPIPERQHLWTLPINDGLPQRAARSESALSLRWVLSLLQDRGRALYWSSSRWQVFDQDRRFGEQRGWTRGRNRYLESRCQLLGVLRTKQGGCLCQQKIESTQTWMRSSWKLQQYENLHEYGVKILLPSNKTSDNPDCVMTAESSREGNAWFGGIQVNLL